MCVGGERERGGGGGKDTMATAVWWRELGDWVMVMVMGGWGRGW